MESKFFDTPFATRSADSDFICKDGELETALNVRLEAKGQELSSLGCNGEEESAPVPEVDFALVRTVLPGWHILPDQFPTKTSVASEPTMEYWTQLGAQLLSQFQSEAENLGFFVSPFYTMSAWKTYDGRFLSPTVPVGLIPNSDVPLVATSGNINSNELEFNIAGAIGELYFKMKAPESLRDWVGKIESLVIFVSEPLHHYNSYSAFIPYKNLATGNYCECLDIESGEILKNRICTNTPDLAWKANLKDIAKGSMSPFASTKFYPYASIPLSEVDLATKWHSATGLIKLTDRTERLYEYLTHPSGNEKPLPVEIKGTGKEIHLVTRPMKLSGGGVLKSLKRVYLRGQFDTGAITFSLHGSRDMRLWWTVARKRGSVLACPNLYFRFYKLEIKGLLGPHENIQGLTLILNPFPE